MQYRSWCILAVVALVGILSGCFVYAQTPSSPDLQALIRDLQYQIQALQQQVKTLQQELGRSPEPTAPAPVAETPVPSASGQLPVLTTPPELTRSLSKGSSGEDVRKLQEFLSQDKEIYPEGLLTGFFGPLTEIAIKKWQEKHGIESVGIVGPKTIAKLQDIGRGVAAGLTQQGAGASGVVPPGLLQAPGIQKKLEVEATTTPVVSTTTPVSVATTTAGTIPAIPATPVIPPPVSGTVPAVPATPATPAVTVSTATTTTATTTASDTTAPSTPTNLTATVISSNQIQLNWTASTDNVKVTGYKIYRGGVYVASVTLAADVPVSSAVATYHYDYTLSPATTYTYTVAVYDAAGNVSGQSNVATATTLSSSSTATSTDTTSPVISNVYTAGGTDSASTSVSIMWTTNELADSQAEYGLTTSYGSNTSLNTSMVNSHAVTLSQLQANTTYYFRIKSKDAAGNLATGTGTFTTVNLAALIISNVQATNITASGATITWTTNKVADSTVYYGLTSNYGSSLLPYPGTDLALTVTSHTASMTGLSAGTTYHYAAHSNSDTGALTSGDYTFTTSSSIPQVQGFSATVSGSSVNLSWQDVTGIYSLAGLISLPSTSMFGSYNIYRGSSAYFTPSLTWPNNNHIVQGSVLSYTDANRPAGTYYYKIALQDKNGVVGPASSAVSAIISNTTTATTTSSTLPGYNLAALLQEFDAILKTFDRLKAQLGDN